MASRPVDFYLPKYLLNQVQAGNHQFFSTAKSALEEAGLSVSLNLDSEAARFMSADTGNYSLFYMQDPHHNMAIDARKAYLGHFWKLEKTTHRAQHYITQRTYNSKWINSERALEFYNRWHDRIVPKDYELPHETGYVFVPLQGKLLLKRSFQSASPIQMIEMALKLDPDRNIIITMHPNETYTRPELDAVERLLDNPRIELADVDLFGLIAGCDYIVTENSSVALKAMFMNKPSILFAWVDFHHMCQNVMTKPAAQCFADVMTFDYGFEDYIFWFLQKQSLNMWRDDAKVRVLQRFQELGWDLG